MEDLDDGITDRDLTYPTDHAIIADIARSRAYIFGLMSKHVHNSADADDITQRVMLRALLLVRSGQFIGEGTRRGRTVRGRLVTLAHRILLRFRRSWLHKTPSENEPDGVDPLPRLEARETVNLLLRRVVRAHRPIMIAIAMGDCLGEIAEERGIPAGTVATIVRHWRSYLRLYLRINAAQRARVR
ncbi:MAG: hypothetical protein IPK82_20020 [Polyangiaceae bacterium]|nr:hypothetical protein [Polyangiaceae bacterium]